jgi:hypothetical protein
MENHSSKNLQSICLTLTHYSQTNVTSDWYIPNGGNTGIGNMLFQISYGLIYAKKNNGILFVPGLLTFFRLENLKKEETIFHKINTNSGEPETISPLNGYFEDYKHFDEYREYILDTFRPLPNIKNYILNKYPMIQSPNICSLHVRLGPDYKQIFYKNQNTLYELQERYFKCMDYMISVKNIDTFFVFTNDPEYCLNILNHNSKYEKIKFIYSTERDFIDVWMISMISNNIVSCSTLAWWGSYLNENENSHIVCNKENLPDLHYPGWIII